MAAATAPRALALALALGLTAGAARAQEPAVDADHRAFDQIRVAGSGETLEGTILEGREAGAPRLRFRTPAGVVTELPRGQVTIVAERETPESAFRARAARLRDGGAPDLHRRLGEWALRHGLLVEGEGEVRLAADRAQDPFEALEHRERLVGLLEARLATLEDGAARDALLEEVLRAVLAGEASAAAGGAGPSARLALARARVAVALGLPAVARPALEEAARALDAVAPGSGGAAADPGAPPEAGEPRPVRPPPRFARDGEGLDPGPGRAPPPAPARPPVDRAAERLPGLDPAGRKDWREVHLLLGSVLERLAQEPAGAAPDALAADEALARAAAAYARVREVWPEDPEACIGAARRLVGAGRRAEAAPVLDEALAVWPKDAALRLARGRLRGLLADDAGAQADLAAAAEASAAETALGRDARVALGLQHLLGGRLDAAASALEAADAAPGWGPARLARGLLAERRGDVAQARALLEEAARLPGARGAARYQLGHLLGAGGDAADAAAALREAARDGYAFELVLRALVDLARRRADQEGEARLLELHARATPTPGPALLARLADAHARAGRLDEARAAYARGLEAAPDDAACLRGLAYCAYRQDDRAAARGLFERVLRAVPGDAWATRGLRQLEEASTRRVWTDRFDRAGPEPKNAWRVEASFGVTPSIADQRLVFDGRQANDPAGKTRVVRTVAGEDVVKVEATFALDRLGDGAAAGLRWEVPEGGAAGAGAEGARGPTVVLYRGATGQLEVVVARSKTRGFEDPVALGPWPGPGARVLSIDLERPEDGTVGLWLDGQRRGEVRVQGLANRRRDVDVSVYAQGGALGAPVDVVVDDVRVFVLRGGAR